MKVRNLMFLALLAPMVQPAVAQPAASFDDNAIAQISGGISGSSFQETKKEESKKGKQKKQKKSSEEKKGG